MLSLRFPAPTSFHFCRFHVGYPLRRRLDGECFLSFQRVRFGEYIWNNVRISIIGDSSKLPKSLIKLIQNVEEVTKKNTRLQLIVAIGYSGKYDIVQACRGISRKVKDGEIEVDEIDEKLIEKELDTKCTEFPYPDLLIRTSGELRVSNFLLWQLAYTELYFAQELWPDFGRSGFIEALVSFQRRQRRFGGRKS